MDNFKALKNLKWLWLSGSIVILDQLTKFMIQIHLHAYESISVLPFLNWVLSYNQGAAFSFLADAEGWQTYFFEGLSGVVIVVLLAWLIRLPLHSKIQAFALSLIIGGALGNLWDRIHYGYVVDFVDVCYRQWHFATFNLADSAISIGGVLLALSLWRK